MALTAEQLAAAMEREARIEALLARMRARLMDIRQYGYTWEDAVADVLLEMD